MPAPKNALQAVLDRQARPAMPQPAEPVASPPAEPQSKISPKKFHRPSREGRKLVAAHFEPKVAKHLKMLAAEEETTVQALLEEALDLLFLKKGKGKIVGV